MGRRPFATRPSPAKAGQIYPRTRIEDDPLGFQEPALQWTTGTDAACAIDDPLPGDRLLVALGQLMERVADGACVAALAHDRRDVAIGGDPAVGHLLDHLIDTLIEPALHCIVHLCCQPALLSVDLLYGPKPRPRSLRLTSAGVRSRGGPAPRCRAACLRPRSRASPPRPRAR